MRSFVVATIVCFGLAPALSAQAAPDAARVLSEMRMASGGDSWNRVAEILERGSMKENGFTGQFLRAEELKTGSYAFTAVFPEVKARIGSGVHGDQRWGLNQQGDLRVEAGAGKDADAVTETYLNRRGYWKPSFEAAAVTMDQPAIEDGMAFERVQIEPIHGAPVVLWIDRRTHLLDRVQRGGSTTLYGDYRGVGGLKVPFSLRHQTKGQEDFAIALDAVLVKPKPDPADVAIPFYRDFDMPGSGVVTVPTEQGLTFEARINGNGPYKMFLDTGSVNILSETAAKELNIAVPGDGGKLAAGDGEVEVRPATVKTLQIGDVMLRDQPFMVMKLPADRGGPVAVLGYEFLQRLVVKIDYVRNQMTMYDAARFAYPGAGIAVPMRVESRGLYVQASVDGFKGLFQLDTGNQVALELSPGFVRINDLLGWTHARFHGYAGRSYAGPLPDAYYARIEKLEIGGTEVDQIAANLSHGEEHDGEPDGSLGQSVLRQFNCTFDVSRGRLYLEKNRNWGPVPFNRAGIVVDPEDQGFRVMTVVPGGGGDAAGLKVGDLITKIDGLRLGGSEDQSAFVRPSGTVLHLTVRRGEGTSEVAVTLKDIL